MQLKYITASLIALSLWSCDASKEKTDNTTTSSKSFVKVKGSQFEIDGKPYYYLGTNFWYAMNLGSKGPGGDRERLLRELDQLQELGIKNLRIMGISEGPDTAPYRIVPSLQQEDGSIREELLEGLDFALVEMGKRDMRAVICLSNFWPWSGGFAQYVQWASPNDSIPYPPPHPNGSYDVYQTFTASFYSNKEALERYFKVVQKVVTRKNSVTQTAYVEDPTIMAWELCNEPRGINNIANYLKWIDSSSSFIKKLDSNHLVTVGSEGETGEPLYSGCDFDQTHQFANIDYTTVHIWIQNWSWYDPRNHEGTYANAKQKAVDYLHRHMAKAKKMNKPYVLEEFGIMKDKGSFDPNASSEHRNAFYELMIGEVYRLAKDSTAASGVNFWAWGGEGRPKKIQGWWRPGDDFVGDPPHEEQGWYSVYNTDTSTNQLLKNYSTKFNELGKSEK